MQRYAYYSVCNRLAKSNTIGCIDHSLFSGEVCKWFNGGGFEAEKTAIDIATVLKASFKKLFTYYTCPLHNIIHVHVYV